MRRPKDPLPGLWRREGLTPDLPLGFSLGGGWVARPAADPSQATGRVKRGATTSFTAPAYWKFESIPLQQRVRLSPDFACVPDKARVFRQFGDDAGRHGRQRRAKPSNIEPRSGSVSVELYSSTGVLPDSVREIGGAGRKRRRFLGVSDLGGALSSDRLKQSRARSADHAKPAASSSLSAVRSGGWRPSRMACVMFEARSLRRRMGSRLLSSIRIPRPQRRSLTGTDRVWVSASVAFGDSAAATSRSAPSPVRRI